MMKIKMSNKYTHFYFYLKVIFIEVILNETNR